MKFCKTIAILTLATSLGYASSLHIYRDSTVYTFQAENTFIGFSEGLKATCKGKEIPLHKKLECPEEERLCKALNEMILTAKNKKTAEENIRVLNTFISLPQPETMDASAWINTARTLSAELSKLAVEEKLLLHTLTLQTKAFEKQAPSKEAMYLHQTCSNDIEVTLPYGQVNFESFYEADITDNKNITVTQYLSVTNRSGIDIYADEADFYYRDAKQYLPIVHFYPWVVSKYEPKVKSYALSKRSVAAMDAAVPMPVVEESRPATEYVASREYRVKNLSLPSTGTPVDIEVTQWKSPMQCDIRVFPYRSSTVFHTCDFTPKLQIDTNKWKVKNGEKIVNDISTGEYYEGKYRLYTKVEHNVEVERKPIVQKERTTGIFGSTARKKDGYTLTITNKSDAKKALIVTERIPISTTEEITVKLLEVKSAKRVNYKLLKENELEIKLSLAPNESYNIEVLFEISYDKDLKVNY